MLDNIILSKITSPKLHSKILKRDRIKSILTGSYTKIWTVVAGPGYGKTTLLLKLKEYLNIPFSWYSPDENDNEIKSFLKYLLHSIQLPYPSFGHKINMILQEYSDIKDIDINTIFLNELTKLDGEIIISIDNYHIIADNKDIQEFMQFMINYLPSNVYLVISSRQKLPFKLNLFTDIEQVINITTKDIKFTSQESRELLKTSITNLKFEKKISAILKYIDGWIIGLLLLIKKLKKNSNNIETNYFNSLTDNTINEYFINYISEASTDYLEFLFFTSLPDIFDLELCSAILNKPKKHFSNYFQEIIFIEDYCIEGQIFYKYHEIFRQFLLKEIDNHFSQPKINFLRIKTGDYYADKHLYSLAINQYLIANDYNKALEILKKTVYRDFCSLETNLMENLIKRFPENITLSEPLLLMLKGQIEYEKGYMDQAIDLNQKAEKIYRDRKDWDSLFIVITNLIILTNLKKNNTACQEYLSMARQYQDQGTLKQQVVFLLRYSYIVDDHQAIVILKQIEELTAQCDSPDINDIKMESFSSLGIKLQRAGEPDEALKYITQVINDTHSRTNEYVLKSQLLSIYFLKGEIHKLLELMQDIETWLEDNNFIVTNNNFIVIMCYIYSLLLFDNAKYTEKAIYYMKNDYNYALDSSNYHSVSFKMRLTEYYAIIARKNNNFSHSIKLFNDMIAEADNIKSKSWAIFVRVEFEYIYTLLLAGNFDTVIKFTEDILENEPELRFHEKLKASIFICTAYLKIQNKISASKGICILKDILEKIIGTPNENILVIYPCVFETLFPHILELNNEIGLSLCEKALNVYSTGVDPYSINKLIELIPYSIFYNNENLIKKAEEAADEKIILIRGLGPLDLKIGTDTIQWERQNLKKLFALLLLYPNGITQNKLIEAIYNNDNKKNNDNLRKLVHFLRKILEYNDRAKELNFIVSENEKYRLNIDAIHYVFDVKEFISHYEKGMNGIKSKNDEIACMEYKKATDLYTGDLFEGVDMMDLEPVREDYKRKCIEMFIFMIQNKYKNDFTDECMNYCNKILNIDKYEETAYDYLIMCYAKKLRKDLMKTAYMTYKKIMKKELKTNIPESTEKLYNELIAK